MYQGITGMNECDTLWMFRHTKRFRRYVLDKRKSNDYGVMTDRHQKCRSMILLLIKKQALV